MRPVSFFIVFFRHLRAMIRLAGAKICVAIVLVVESQVCTLQAIAKADAGNDAVNDSVTGTDFEFLEPLFTEALGARKSLDTAYAKRGELTSAIESAQARNLPSVSLNADTGLNKSWLYHDTTRLNPNSAATLSLQGGIALRQNIYAGGADSLREQLAQGRLKAHDLDMLQRQNSLKNTIVKDLVALIASRRMLVQRTREIEQARLLAANTTRKEKGGFLSSREKLESQRETVRSENEHTIAKLQLFADIAVFNLKHNLSQEALSETTLTQLTTRFDSLFKKGESLLTQPDQTKQKITHSSLSVVANTWRFSLHDQETRLQKLNLWNPSVDASIGLNASTSDTSNVPDLAKAQTTNRQLGASARIGFSMNVYNPQGAAQKLETEARRKSLETERSQLHKNINSRTINNTLKRDLNAAKLKSLRQIVALGQGLSQTNARLFEAGEIDIGQYITSQADLYSQEQALLQLENQMRLLAIETLLSAVYGLSIEEGSP